MAHEIDTHDHVVLHKNRAWHGLGTIVQDAPTPREALTLAKLDWEVQQWPLSATDGEGTRLAIESHVVNVRSDTLEPLGIVGQGWTPIQNKDMAEFCESLAEQSDTVKVESAGSIRNGRKVWFLLKGESFSVRGGDEVKPYICVSNGFDGATGFRATPTTIRVVCSNTLHMVIPQTEGKGRMDVAGFTCRHTGSIKERVEEAKAVLQLYGHALDGQRELIDSIAARDVTREDCQRFFLECYTSDFGGIADVPSDKKQKRARDKAMEGFAKFSERFDRERDIAGPTAWNALNSYTGWLQHDKKSRLKDEDKAAETTLASNLFGTNSERSVNAFAKALAI